MAPTTPVKDAIKILFRPNTSLEVLTQRDQTVVKRKTDITKQCDLVVLSTKSNGLSTIICIEYPLGTSEDKLKAAIQEAQDYWAKLHKSVGYQR